MILYLDTSAFLKLYVKEPESAHVRQAIKEAVALCTHVLTYAEARAGFARAVRMGRLTPRRLTTLKRDLERDWQRVDVLGVDEALVRRAGDLAERFALRGYDSVHLAAAEAAMLRLGGSVDFRFLACDATLATAAASLGLASGI
ncbi:MAG TPA: type II toxin-antitoxin system VapC family toxin [bacterium]|jgi:predicted nucleic acid-binding protein